MEQKTQKLVRLHRKDLPGEASVENALRKIKGINVVIARAIRIKSGIDTNKRMGDLNPAELKKIEHLLDSPHEMNAPSWTLNRRKDVESGIDTHIFESGIMLRHREDIGRMQKIRSYRGVRHMFGLPCRGQRTKSTGRKNRTMGVQRKKRGSK